MEPKRCELCGTPLRDNNKYGLCAKSAACRKERCRRQHLANGERNRERNRRWVADNAEAKRASVREWRAKNKERVAASKKRYKQSHPESVKQWRKTFYERHKEQVLQEAEAWRANNPERAKAVAREWVEANRERVRKTKSRWKQNNPDQSRADCHIRRARQFGVNHERFANSEVFERDGYVCQRCGVKTLPRTHKRHPRHPNLDHIIPLSKGGTHTRQNVQCLCHSCNWKKRNSVGGDQLLLIG